MAMQEIRHCELMGGESSEEEKEKQKQQQEHQRKKDENVLIPGRDRTRSECHTHEYGKDRRHVSKRG
jgi:hypothetical protein